MGSFYKVITLHVFLHLTVAHNVQSQKKVLNLDSLEGKSSVEYYGYPTPIRTSERLFFIQRNISKNVVVYDANLKDDGSLNVKDPAKVYWKRYNNYQGGKVRELKWIERNMAYKLKVYDTGIGHSTASIVSYKATKFNIVQRDDGRIEAVVSINGRKARMHYIFMHMEEDSFFHEVNYLEVGGEDLETGEVIFEQFLPK